MQQMFPSTLLQKSSSVPTFICARPSFGDQGNPGIQFLVNMLTVVGGTCRPEGEGSMFFQRFIST